MKYYFLHFILITEWLHFGQGWSRICLPGRGR